MRRSPIYIEADTPKFLEDHVDTSEDVMDLANENAASLLELQRETNRNFDTAPFDPDGGRLKFFPGGYTVWSGFPGAGKTTILRQLICHLMHYRKRKVFAASMEQNPRAFFLDLCVTAHGVRELSEDNVQWGLDAWQDSLRIFSYRRGIASHSRIFAIIGVLAREGVRHAVIDSLMALDIGSQDWEAQRTFAVNLAAVCERTGVHVHLVAHPRKPSRAGEQPDISDVAGSADIGRYADSVLFLQRLDEGPMTAGISKMRICVKKQRYGDGLVGNIDGYFHREIRQYKATEYDTTPTRYLPGGAYGEVLFG